MTMAPPEPEPSDYDWIGELGEGGFARVSKVRYRRTGEVFALKEAFYPSPDAHEEGEVLRRAAGYASAYVVRYHAVFLDPDGGLSSVLELMDAGSLFSVLRRRGDHGFREPALAEVATRCLMGLAQLHSRGVAHLDVKPENFLANAEGEIKVNDFNAARVVYGRAGERLMVPTTTGTVPYYSPERFERDARADPRRHRARSRAAESGGLEEGHLQQGAAIRAGRHGGVVGAARLPLRVPAEGCAAAAQAPLRHAPRCRMSRALRELMVENL